MSKCSADETPVCCCMDVGTIMDKLRLHRVLQPRVCKPAQKQNKRWRRWTEKARSVESEPCKISRLSLKSLTVCAWISISLLPAKLKC
ncbi:protein YfcZ [Escherichia coli]|uniref:Protein YfcZ n=1 Tax=Escherichia coli TaxID=562 RepID=A0A376KRZ4_ECOLX|nr:protein YfcZ [Escherichia coli]